MASEEGLETSVTSHPNIPESLLNDLCSRFLINIPDNEKNDMVRICFQIELAHWYYIDFCRQEDPDLPPCGMKAFISKILTDYSFLNKSQDSIQSIYENWKLYKVRVPVFGAILLDESLENCLLVQGYHNKTSWGFPKGKVNKDEGHMECAVREVWEEVGYDIAPLANPDQYLENNFHDHQIRLYIIPGVNPEHKFKPNTRGEIKEIRWFPVEFLPTHKKDTAPKDEFGLMANNFFMIHSFIKPLRKWIAEKKSNMSSLAINPLYANHPLGINKEQNKDKKAEEKKELQRKQRKEKEAEEFKRMHSLMNPLRSSKEDEDMLKSLLGLSSKSMTNTPQSEAGLMTSKSNISNTALTEVSLSNNKGTNSISQPEAIQKLLSGTVSPVITSKNNSRYYSAGGRKSKELPQESQEFGSSPHGFRIGGNLSSPSPKKEINDIIKTSRNSNITHTPSKNQFRPFSPSHNLMQHSGGDAAYKPHHHRPFLSSDDRRTKHGQMSHETKYIGRNLEYSSPSRSPVSESIADFNFSAPAFANFRLDYKEITTALMTFGNS